MGAKITAIDPGSPVRNKVRIGDELLAINGNEIIDVLDYKFFSDDRQLVLTLRTPEGKYRMVSVRKKAGADLGLDFENYLMDKARACRNRCLF